MRRPVAQAAMRRGRCGGPSRTQRWWHVEDAAVAAHQGRGDDGTHRSRGGCGGGGMEKKARLGFGEEVRAEKTAKCRATYTNSD